MKFFIVLALAACAVALEDTADVKAAKASFMAAFDAAKKGEHAALAPKPIANFYNMDAPDVAMAKDKFMKLHAAAKMGASIIPAGANTYASAWPATAYAGANWAGYNWAGYNAIPTAAYAMPAATYTAAAAMPTAHYTAMPAATYTAMPTTTYTAAAMPAAAYAMPAATYGYGLPLTGYGMPTMMMKEMKDMKMMEKKME